MAKKIFTDETLLTFVDQIKTYVDIADQNHTHNYAGSSSAGGEATSALTCSGNSATSTTLETARNINGVPFDGSADITVPAQFGIKTAGTGAAYTATVPGVTTLTVGTTFVMIPHTASTSKTPTLDVNGLGAKGIRRRLSNISTTVQSGYSTNWLGANQPFTVVYNGTYWIVEGNIKTAAVDLYGTLAVNKGGTGATTEEAARTNLGVYSTDEVDNLLGGKSDTSHNHDSINTTNGDPLQVFVGTQAEYEALESKSNLFAIITDDPNIDKLNTIAEAVAEHENDISELKTVKARHLTNISAISQDDGSFAFAHPDSDIYEKAIGMAGVLRFQMPNTVSSYVEVSFSTLLHGKCSAGNVVIPFIYDTWMYSLSFDITIEKFYVVISNLQTHRMATVENTTTIGTTSESVTNVSKANYLSIYFE